MKLKTYLARMDNGHDFRNLVYRSEHKAGSEANKADCLQTFRRKYGRSEARRWRVVDVQRVPDDYEG